MKRIVLSYLVLFLFLSCNDKESNDNTVVIGDFSFSSSDITQNEPFTITYNGTDTLEDSFYFALQHSKALPDDLVFNDNQATITIADSISGVAFNFKVNGTYPNNDKQGFLFKVKDSYGNYVGETKASLGYYKMTYGEQYDIDAEPKEVLAAIDEALAKDSKLENDWFKTHIYVANQAGSDEGKTVSEKYIGKYSTKSDLKLEDYEALYDIYRATRNRMKADSIIAIVGEKFPESNLAFEPTIDRFFDAKGLEAKEAIFNDNKERLLASSDASYIVRTLARFNFIKGNTEAFKTYVGMMEKNTDKASLFNTIAWPNAEKGKAIEASAELSLQSLKLIEQEQKTLKEKPDYYSPNNYKRSLESTYNMYSDTYALLAFQKGDIKEAIKYQAIAISKNGSPEMHERYVQFLMADEQYELAKTSAEKFIEEGSSTAKLKEFYLDVFEKSGGTGDAQALLAELEVKAKKKELEDLRKTLLDEASIDFTLKNLDGEDVTLSSLKGKTVVLDFWATWCGPCIASFPGMQKVVTKYKDNEDVVFLFVDTFEDGNDRVEKVAKFIKDNNYDFNVIFDPIAESGNKHVVANNYKVSGIPTKIIIGPSGNIKFKSVGYSGSAEKVVSEIDAMVELLGTNP